MKELQPNQKAAAAKVVAYFNGEREPIKVEEHDEPSELDGEDVVNVKIETRFPCQRVVVLFGGTGSGKTLITCASMKMLSASKTTPFWAPANPKTYLIVVPPCGGVVFDQWIEELADQGEGDRTLLYHGNDRANQLAKWRQLANDSPDAPHYVVTSINTLHADAAKLLKAEGSADPKKKLSDDKWRVAFAAAAATLGAFDMLVIDEFQEFRNGSPPNDGKRQIDQSKKFYGVLDAVAAHSRPRVLGLSATPVVNTSGEFFTLLRLGRAPPTHANGDDVVTYERDPDRVYDTVVYKDGFVKKVVLSTKSIDKAKIVDHARRSTDAAVKRAHKEEKRRIAAHTVVAVATPDLPETTYVEVKHGYNEPEKKVLFADYGALVITAAKFYKALLSWMEAPEHPMRRLSKDVWKRRFLAALTHSKRLTVAPLAFARPRERGDPFLDPAVDASGSVIMVKGDDGQQTPLGRLLPYDVVGAHASTPLTSISKFCALVDDLRATTDRRSMIVAEYTDVIELLALYLRDALPERAVFKFHGKVSARANQLAAFKTGPVDAILLCTRGSMGMAVNVEATSVDDDGIRLAVVQYQLDLPLSQSGQDQTEGRIKRPVAQGFPGDADRVREWVVKKVLAEVEEKPTIDDWNAYVMKLKQSRCADFFVDKEEEAADGRDTSINDDEEANGALKQLIDMFSCHVRAEKRAASAPEPAPAKRAKPGHATRK